MRAGQNVVDYIEYVEYTVCAQLAGMYDPDWVLYQPSSYASVQRGVDVLYREQIDVRTGFTGLEKLALMWDSQAAALPGDPEIMNFSMLRTMRGGYGMTPPATRKDADEHLARTSGRTF